MSTTADVRQMLSAADRVRRVQPSGSLARYESPAVDSHHHVVCRWCCAVVDVGCAVGERPCLTASEDNGFSVDGAEVVYWRLCRACATASS